MPQPWILSIDFGTSYTLVAAKVGDRTPEVVEIGGERRMPSVVMVETHGQRRRRAHGRRPVRVQPGEHAAGAEEPSRRPGPGGARWPPLPGGAARRRPAAHRVRRGGRADGRTAERGPPHPPGHVEPAAAEPAARSRGQGGVAEPGARARARRRGVVVRQRIRGARRWPPRRVRPRRRHVRHGRGHRPARRLRRRGPSRRRPEHRRRAVRRVGDEPRRRAAVSRGVGTDPGGRRGDLAAGRCVAAQGGPPGQGDLVLASVRRSAGAAARRARPAAHHPRRVRADRRALHRRDRRPPAPLHHRCRRRRNGGVEHLPRRRCEPVADRRATGAGRVPERVGQPAR